MRKKSNRKLERIISMLLVFVLSATSFPVSSLASSAKQETLHKRSMSGNVKLIKVSNGRYFDSNYKYTDAGNPVYCTQANGKSPTSVGKAYVLEVWEDYSKEMKKGLYAILQKGYQGGTTYPYGTESQEEAYYATQIAVHLWVGHFGKDSSCVNTQAKAMTWTVSALQFYADNYALPEKNCQFKVQNTDASKRAFYAGMMLLKDALNIEYEEATISLTGSGEGVKEGNYYVYTYHLAMTNGTSWTVKQTSKISGVKISPTSGTLKTATITVKVPVSASGKKVNILAECEAKGTYALDNFRIFISSNDASEQRVVYAVEDEISDADACEVNFVLPQSGGIKIYKKRSDTGKYSNSLEGTKFTVYSNAACTTSVGEITIGKTGAGKLENLPLGMYYVKETDTPAGYVEEDTVYTVELTSGNLIELIVKNAPNSVPLEVIKLDETGNPLTGAEFTVYAEKNNSKTFHKLGVMKDNRDGTYSYTVTFPAGGVLAYKIKIEETKNPNHYTGIYKSPEIDIANSAGEKMTFTVRNHPEELYLEILKTDQEGTPITTKTEFSVTDKIDAALIAESVTFGDDNDSEVVIISNVTMPDGTVYSQQDFIYNGISSSYKNPGEIVVYYDGANKASQAPKGWYQFNDTLSGSVNMYLYSDSWTYLGYDINYGDVIFTAYPWSETLKDYTTEGIELSNNLKGLHSLKLTWTKDNQGKVKVVETATQTGYLPNTEIWFYDLNGSTVDEPVKDTVVNIGKQITMRLIKQDTMGTAVSLNALTEAKFGIFEWDNTIDDYVLIGYHNTKGGLKVSGVIESTGIYKVTNGLQYSEKNEGKFKWVELQPPKGYTIYNGQEKELNVFVDNQNGETESTIAYSSTFYNQAATGFVRITKVDAFNGKLLPGAEFTLYRLITNNSTTVEQRMGALTDNGDGTYVYEGLTNGNYRIEETTAPKGYTGTTKSLSFEIDTTATGNDIAVRNFYAVVENTPYSGSVKITKKDSVSNVLLTGAEFILQQWSEDTGTYEDYYTLTESSSGVYESNIFTYSVENKGKFRVVETKNPQGYTGKFEKLIQLTEEHQEYIFEAEARNTPYEGDVTVTKIDNLTGEKLGGAEFILYEWNGSDYRTRGTLMDNGDGTYSTDILYYTQSNEGKFKIAEIGVPYGYAQDSAWEEAFELTRASQDFVFIAANTPITGSLLLKKVDSENNTSLAQNDAGTFEGTVYTLYAKEDIYDNSVAKNLLYRADDVITELAVAADGITSVEELPIGNYYLQETMAANGYYIDETQYDVTITEADATVTLTISDTPIKASAILTKTDQYGNALSGVGFSVYRLDTLEGVLDSTLISDREGAYTKDMLAEYDFSKDTPVTAEVFSDTSGTVKVPAQRAGLYVIVETTTPSGYIKAKPILWLIDENNAYMEKVNFGAVVNEQQTGWLTLEKKDAETNKLVMNNVASFRIYDVKRDEYITAVYDAENNYYVQTAAAGAIDLFTTDFTGTFTVKIYPGTYRMEEVAKPYGYLLNLNIENVTVVASSTTTETILDTPMKGEIIIRKTGYEIAAVTTKNNATTTLPDGSTYTTVVPEFTYNEVGLAGATYTITADEDIYSADGQNILYTKGTKIITVTTGDDGKARISNLPLGWYTITEIKAPDGYKRDDTTSTINISEIDYSVEEDFGNL
ncbi:MAG: hypothetical protein E7269_01965 [Lachnospiraceae bacterium]|nr:hypothetical protein [Lachnospiraceae bacterium]